MAVRKDVTTVAAGSSAGSNARVPVGSGGAARRGRGAAAEQGSWTEPVGASMMQWSSSPALFAARDDDIPMDHRHRHARRRSAEASGTCVCALWRVAGSGESAAQIMSERNAADRQTDPLTVGIICLFLFIRAGGPRLTARIGAGARAAPARAAARGPVRVLR